MSKNVEKKVIESKAIEDKTVENKAAENKTIEVKANKEPISSWTMENSMLKAKTKVRITFPENTKDQRLFELAQITAPGGLTIEFKLPFAMMRPTLTKLADSVKLIGGTVEINE